MTKKLTVASSILIIAALLVSCAPTVTQPTTIATTAPAATRAPVVSNNITTVAEQNAYEQIYAAVNPSVVNIRVVQNQSSTQQDSQYSVPNFPGFPQLNSPQQQQQVPTQVEGAGFIFDSDGHIITNNHVVTDASRIIVTFADGTQAEAKVVGTDPGTDLAVIQVSADTSSLKPVALADAAQLKVGQIVIAIGSPFGLQGSMTTGIISSLGRTIENSNSSSNITSSTAYYSIPDIIQTDAAINHGNSGGPLLDLNGEVVGINTAIESTSDSSAGVGYVIPSSIIKLVATALINSGKIEHTYLGLTTVPIDSDLAKAMNLPENTLGILVEKVSADSPSGKAGLKGSTQEVTIDGIQRTIGGDVITGIDGNQVKDYNDLISYLLLHTTVGQQVNLEVIRGGKTITVPVTLAARPASS